MKYIAFTAALLISSLTAAPSFSQETTSPASPEAAAPPASPDASGPNSKFVTKLAGLVLFVSNSCPKTTIDYDRFKEAVTGLGVKVDALSADPLRLESLSYFASYGSNIEGNCARALTEFGTQGRIIRGIFIEK